MKHKIITISREFGSGGRTVGKQLAQKLGIPCYDQELIEKMAEESGFSQEYVQENCEHAGWFTQVFSSRSLSGMSTQDYLWLVQREVILKLAEEGPCVIVGRCADVILKGRTDLLRVFVYADLEQRAERIVKVYGETDQTPEKRLRDKDKRRAAYYSFYTDSQWGKPQNYDICLNSGFLGIDGCVDILEKIA